MDIQTRKLEFIQEFIEVQNEDVINRLEKILRKEKKQSDPHELKRLTIDDLNNRIDKSLKDSKEGRLIDAKELKREIDNFSMENHIIEK